MERVSPDGVRYRAQYEYLNWQFCESITYTVAEDSVGFHLLPQSKTRQSCFLSQREFFVQIQTPRNNLFPNQLCEWKCCLCSSVMSYY